MLENQETELLSKILYEIKGNPKALFPNQEWSAIWPTIKPQLVERWFEQVPMHSKLCERCLGRTCRIEFENIDHFIPCPHGVQEIIDITDVDRIKYRFEFNKFLNGIQAQLGLAESINSENHLQILGTYEWKEDYWQIVFAFNDAISIGSIINMRISNPASFSLVILDQQIILDDYELAKYASFGIFHTTWDQPLAEIIQRFYTNELHEMEIVRELSKTEGISGVLNEMLLKTATEGKGTPFETAVYKAVKRLFQVVLPFGGSYSGFSVPDGLILDSDEQPFPTLFYDCKSFIGDSYKHKPEIAMQVNYYEGFLREFYAKVKYRRTGFAIIASSFPEAVQQQISGSAQWKYVFDNFKVFFMDISFLQSAMKFIDDFEVEGDQFIKLDFMRFCFDDDISKLSEQAQSYYLKLYDQSVYTNNRFLNGEISEIAIVTALLNKLDNQSGLDGVSKDLKSVLRMAKHENMERTVKRPVIFSFMNQFIEKIRNNTIFDDMHPLSILTILERNDDELSLQLGEELLNSIEDITIGKLNDLVSGRHQ